MNYLKSEPVFKKAILMLSFGMVFMILISLLSNYFAVQRLYNEHLRVSKQLVGSMASIYPKDETKIINTVLRKNDKKSYNYGDKILKKYGYDSKVTAFKDEGFSENVKYIFTYNIIIFLLLFLMVLYIFLSSSLHLIKKLNQISNNIDSIINGSFSTSQANIDEGILSKINIGFYQMSRTLKMNLNNLKLEKENIKSLITDISHQLKTPLASIKMYNAILIEDEDITFDEKMEFLQTSKNEINKLEWLIGSLIKLSRLEAGMIELKVSNSSITKTICDAVEGISAKALQKNMQILIEPHDEYIILHDYRWTKEAIINVLENAVKYCNENGIIKISIASMNSYIKVDIADNGIGIPAKDFNNVFKRFFRGDSEIVKTSEGSGVGLYLTRRILESQGGSITVDSLLGRGTTFSLFLQKCK